MYTKRATIFYRILANRREHPQITERVDPPEERRPQIRNRKELQQLSPHRHLQSAQGQVEGSREAVHRVQAAHELRSGVQRVECHRKRHGGCPAENGSLSRLAVIEHRHFFGRRGTARGPVQGVHVLRQLVAERLQAAGVAPVESGGIRGERDFEERRTRAGAPGEDGHHVQVVRSNRHR